MFRKLNITGALLLSALTLWSEEKDSLSVSDLNELIVRGVRAPKDAPFAITKIQERELGDFSRSGQELPFLLARTPGVLAWSDNGVGTGTCYLRMRGSSDSRINITLDGVSLNNPEDQCVFWANTNSYASLLGSVQIQRGIGSSTNGDGAFGGSVSLHTKAPSLDPCLELSTSYGSWNTYHAGGNFSSGLIGKHLIVEGAYHHTGTDGYLRGTGGNSGSYYGAVSWLSSDGTLKVSYKHIGNYEHTGQAWNGITQELFDQKKWRENTLQATDHYRQNHHLFSAAWFMSDHWNSSLTLHYTHDNGYYLEKKPQCKLSKFGLSPYALPNGEFLTTTDMDRRKGLKSDTYGLCGQISYDDLCWNLTGGFSLQGYDGKHDGLLTHIENMALRQALLADGPYRYYHSKARKEDANLFFKATQHLSSHWDAFADLQWRYAHICLEGENDKFILQADNHYKNMPLDIDKPYHFVNPKAGLNYRRGAHTMYGSYAMSHREPERNNFTDNGSYPPPSAESLHDIEIGYSFQGSKWHATMNLYAMLYHNQFVKTGELSDIGESLTTNILHSNRLGAEFSLGWKATRWLSLEANAALSRNRILDFTETLEDWDNGSTAIPYHCSTLAFSPSAIVNGFADVQAGRFHATWHTAFVSRQYLDNTACKERSIPSYCRTDILCTYDLKWKSMKGSSIGLNLQNILNRHYAANGWVYSAMGESSGYTQEHRYTEMGLFPMSGFTVSGSLTLRF